ncbi:MAG: hypothetical protein V5A57_03290 [Candidatus Paceibacterota bacterium]
MSKEELIDWYRNKITEIPNEDCQIENQTSNRLDVSSQAKEIPSEFSIEINLSSRQLKFLAPISPETPEDGIELLCLSSVTDSSFAIGKFRDKAQFVIQKDLPLYQELKLSESDFYSNLIRFFAGWDVANEIVASDVEYNQSQEKNKSPQKTQ